MLSFRPSKPRESVCKACSAFYNERKCDGFEKVNMKAEINFCFHIDFCPFLAGLLTFAASSGTIRLWKWPDCWC